MAHCKEGMSLTPNEKELVHGLRLWLDSSGGEEIISEETLTIMGQIAQKIAASHDSLSDNRILETLMETLSNATEAQIVAIAQNKTILRGLFAGSTAL